MSQTNKDLVRRYFEVTGNKEQYASLVDQVCAPNYVHHDPNLPVPDANLETHKKIIRDGFMVAFPDLHVTIHEMVAEGDRVAVRWTFGGTHRGELPGNPPVPPTGKQVAVSAASIHRISAGKIAESWVHFDAMGMMQQLGVIQP